MKITNVVWTSFQIFCNSTTGWAWICISVSEDWDSQRYFSDSCCHSMLFYVAKPWNHQATVKCYICSLHKKVQCCHRYLQSDSSEKSDQSEFKDLVIARRQKKGHMVAIWTQKTEMQLDWWEWLWINTPDSSRGGEEVEVGREAGGQTQTSSCCPK